MTGLTEAHVDNLILNRETLKRTAPELFVPGYSRNVQVGRQPKIISDSEIREWESKTYRIYKESYNEDLRINQGGHVICHRKVLVYHRPNGSKLYFVAPSDERPIIGLCKNNLPNKEEFPWIPCCYGCSNINKNPLLNPDKSPRDPVHFKYWEPSQFKVFALVVLNSDGILNVSGNQDPATRFFRIIQELPMELQMVICHRLRDSMRNNISSQEFEQACREMIRDL